MSQLKDNYRLKQLFHERKRAEDVQFALAMFGLAVMVIENEILWLKDKTDVAVGARYFVFCVVCFMFYVLYFV